MVRLLWSRKALEKSKRIYTWPWIWNTPIYYLRSTYRRHISSSKGTVFENHRKKSHLSLREKRATFTFWVDKSSLKIAKNGPIWPVFENLKACGQTELPDRSVLICQKLVENTKTKKIQMRHFGWFSNTVEHWHQKWTELSM